MLQFKRQDGVTSYSTVHTSPVDCAAQKPDCKGYSTTRVS